MVINVCYLLLLSIKNNIVVINLFLKKSCVNSMLTILTRFVSAMLYTQRNNRLPVQRKVSKVVGKEVNSPDMSIIRILRNIVFSCVSTRLTKNYSFV